MKASRSSALMFVFVFCLAYMIPKVVARDGMAAANGRLYIATTDGGIVCLGEK